MNRYYLMLLLLITSYSVIANSCDLDMNFDREYWEQPVLKQSLPPLAIGAVAVSLAYRDPTYKDSLGAVLGSTYGLYDAIQRERREGKAKSKFKNIAKGALLGLTDSGLIQLSGALLAAAGVSRGIIMPVSFLILTGLVQNYHEPHKRFVHKAFTCFKETLHHGYP